MTNINYAFYGTLSRDLSQRYLVSECNIYINLFLISLPQVEYMYVGRYVYIVCQLMDKVFNAAGIYTFAAPKQLQSLSLL